MISQPDLYRRRGATGVAAAAIGVILCALAVGCGGHTRVVAAVTSISPHDGSRLGGTTVLIHGNHFRDCGSSTYVAFGADPGSHNPLPAAEVTVLSDDLIRAVTPPSYEGGVDVQVYTDCGWSLPLPYRDNFTFGDQGTSPCMSGTCTAAVEGRSVGAITHVADGFLEGYTGAVPAGATQFMSALHPRSWRYAVPTPQLQALVQQTGAQTNSILEGFWLPCTTCGDVQRPWEEPATFAAYYTSTVRKLIASGTAPDYWDVWNEPTSTGTVGQWLSMFKTAYHAIKVADPAAKIVGPDISQFRIRRAPSLAVDGSQLDLTTFLDFAARNNLQFAALAYHDAGSSSGGLDADPSDLATHVRTVRQLVADHPQLAGMQVFVDEYGPSDAASEPGWLVGMFSALEASQPRQANLACADATTCASTIGGLLGLDGAPQMPYWVYADYAAMTGNRLNVATSASNLSLLADRQRSGDIDVLLGRHDTCGPPPLPHLAAAPPENTCPRFRASTHPPVAVHLTVPAPPRSRTASVSIQILPNSARSPVGQNPVPAAPPAAASVMPVVNGQVTVTLPALDDGDAVDLLISPATPRA